MDATERDPSKVLLPPAATPAAAAADRPLDVEAALARAMDAAVAAGRFDAIPALVEELRARRLARTGVRDLEAERRKRGG